MSTPESTTGDVHSAFRPCPGHHTRENWLAYRVIAQLCESGLDINTSPAVQVWDVAHREIIAWMKEHGIKTGLRPQERDTSPIHESTPDNIPADVREAIRQVFIRDGRAYLADPQQADTLEMICAAIAPFFAAKDAEIAEAKRMTSEINASQSRWIEKCAEEVARAETAEKQLAEANAILDWVDSQECWIGLSGKYHPSARFYVGGNYDMKVRSAYDAAMQQEGEQ